MAGMFIGRIVRMQIRGLWKPSAMPQVEKGVVPHVVPTAEGGRVFARLGDSPKTISYWHDIPYRSAAGKDTYTFVCEIPANTTAKMEMHKDSEHNPIVQDKVKKGPKQGSDRFYAHPIPWNYGFIPQTFEDPSRVDEQTKCKGDGDPIDVVVITPGPMKMGDIDTIKVLGSLALIDEGETDWKVIAMLTSDVRANTVHSVKDIPEIVDSIRTWFRDYKIPDGKPANQYAFEGKPLQTAATMCVIEDTHFDWKELFSNINK